MLARLPFVHLQNFLEVYFVTEFPLHDAVVGVIDRLCITRYVSAGNVPAVPVLVNAVDEENFTVFLDENFHGGKRSSCAVKILKSSLGQKVIILGNVPQIFAESFNSLRGPLRLRCGDFPFVYGIRKAAQILIYSFQNIKLVIK